MPKSGVISGLVLILDIIIIIKLGLSKAALTLVLLNPDIPVFANSVDPDQLASETDLDLHCLP